MTKKELKELIDLPMTNFGNALRLQYLFGKRWVYLPKYRYWVYRDSHSWKGKRTVQVVYDASDAFRHLAQDIYQMPDPEDEWERDQFVRAIAWLTLSQCTARAKHAVHLFRDMQKAEAIIREDVLRG